MFEATIFRVNRKVKWGVCAMSMSYEKTQGHNQGNRSEIVGLTPRKWLLCEYKRARGKS